MKIAKIEVRNYRGFPGPATYTFDLAGGRNLAIYGDNGSGKSSLFHAIDEVFNCGWSARPFEVNAYARDENGSPVTDGHVAIHLTDGTPSSVVWQSGGKRPLSDARVADAALRRGCLEYKSLLRTCFVEGPLPERLFFLAAEVLLANIPVALPGAMKTRSIGEYWKSVHKPKNHHSGNRLRAEDAINAFNTAMKAIIPDVQKKISDILELFGDLRMSVEFDFPGMRYDRDKRRFADTSLFANVTFNGKGLTDHEHFLNEARLSALALSMYLASIYLSNPASRAGVAVPLKLLVLDDVLIGLDLCHREPVVRILNTPDFADYQVFLFTFDRVWFDMLHMQTQDTGKWVYQELYSRHFDDPGYDIPLHKAAGGYLQRAREHYSQRDMRAAAVYVRAAFETRLKNFCSDKKLPVAYDKEPSRITSDPLWSAVTAVYGGDGTCHVDEPTKAAIETVRKVVLNPLSHAGASSITPADVQRAIQTVEALKFV